MSRSWMVLWLFLPGYGSAQTAAPVDSFYAPSIASTSYYSYLLPEEYDSLRSYPVLYLLHGYGGNHLNWTELTNIPEYGGTLGVIIIMPNAANSWYVNSATGENSRYENLIIDDLSGHVERRFRIDTTRQAIAGLSMGGYGAIMLALRHPRQFRFAGSLSGALSFPGILDSPVIRKPEESLTSAKKVFGLSVLFHKQYDVMRLYKNSPPQELPYMYFAVGIQDDYTTFLEAHRTFTDLIRAYGARYEYHETPGSHSWKYWGKEIRSLLKKMTEVLGKQPRE